MDTSSGTSHRKGDGRWLISYRRLSRLRVEHTPGFFSTSSGGFRPMAATGGGAPRALGRPARPSVG